MGKLLYAMVPLPFFLFGFKWYCKKSFDDKILYYSTIPYSDLENNHNANNPKTRKGDKVGVRFGNPAIYKKLITPMVHAKSQHLLKQVYGHGRPVIDTRAPIDRSRHPCQSRLR